MGWRFQQGLRFCRSPSLKSLALAALACSGIT
jgi:hypothetical protein